MASNKTKEPQKIIYISSRKSDLALVQTNEVLEKLKTQCPDKKFEIGLADTVGDQILDKHLSEIGTDINGGLFTKSLEKEMLEGRSRLAVHSLKDMPTRLPSGLMLAAICKRESPEDAVIIHPKHKEKNILKLEDLPEGSIIGTSSLRREALVLRDHPSFIIKTIRGNIQTRLKKLDEADDYDAIIVAAAGFRRGGLGDRIDQILPSNKFGYGVGQGSIGIECREDDKEIQDILKNIEDEISAQQCQAERSLLYHVEGGCQIAMGVHTIIDQDNLTLKATILSRNGKEFVEETITGNRFKAESLGKELANRFLKNNKAVELLGPRGQKRALTYGNIEKPGEAAKQAKLHTNDIKN